MDPSAIINSIKDWLDSGDDDAITGLSGAESAYYQDLDPPYPCRNGPFPHLGELALLKGVTAELFERYWGYIRSLTIYYGSWPREHRREKDRLCRQD